MELLLICEVKQWELLFWKEMKAFLDAIGNDRGEEKERLTREWRANCWKRLNSHMHAAQKRWSESEDIDNVVLLRREWSSSIMQFFEGVEIPDSISLSKLKEDIKNSDIKEVLVYLRLEEEIEDTEFRLKLGEDLRRFDLFWDNYSLFQCRYSRSKWLYLRQHPTIPLEIYSRALERNKNITHISFSPHSDVNGFHAIIRDLTWVTSISHRKDWLPAINHRDLLFIKSQATNNDLISFAKDIRPKLDSCSTYIFTDVEGFHMDPGRLRGDARVLISFVAPSGESLVLKVKHSGSEDAPLEVTLGSIIIQLNPSSKSLLTIDDITLHSTQDPEPDHPGLLFEREVRNDIIINFTGGIHFIRDVELLDKSGLAYPRNSKQYSAF